MEKTKINWKEEDNAYINKIFDKINIVYAFIIILAPLISSFMSLLGVDSDVVFVYFISGCLFVLIRIVYYSLNFRFIKFRKIDLMEILGLVLMVTFLVSVCINLKFVTENSYGLAITTTFNYFIVFLTITRLDKKHYKKLLYTFILTLTVCSIMGICDLSNSYMPGFSENTFPMSLQFNNSNYSAYITIMAIVLCIYVLWNNKKLAEQIIFWTCFVVLNVALFINGCFSAETAMFVAELFLLIWFWIKNKKCPWIILACMLISIASSFVWIKGVSTSNANYMYEALAVIDNKLDTHLVESVSTFFDKIFHTGVIGGVVGSDGWDRENLKAKAWKQIFSSPKACLFGSGAGLNHEIGVHNVYIHMWLEFGLFVVGLYVAILVLLVVRLFKTRFSSHNMFLVAVFIAVTLVCQFFGCLDPFSFTYWTCILAAFTKEINGKMVKPETQEKVLIDNENSETGSAKQEKQSAEKAEKINNKAES